MTTDLEKRFGFLVVDVGRLYGKRYDELAKSSLELTRAQCRMIAYLAHYGDMNQARLAELLALFRELFGGLNPPVLVMVDPIDGAADGDDP